MPMSGQPDFLQKLGDLLDSVLIELDGGSESDVSGRRMSYRRRSHGRSRRDFRRFRGSGRRGGFERKDVLEVLEKITMLGLPIADLALPRRSILVVDRTGQPEAPGQVDRLFVGSVALAVGARFGKERGDAAVDGLDAREVVPLGGLFEEPVDLNAPSAFDDDGGLEREAFQHRPRLWGFDDASFVTLFGIFGEVEFAPDGV
jgi:hypothetical protein